MNLRKTRKITIALATILLLASLATMASAANGQTNQNATPTETGNNNQDSDNPNLIAPNQQNKTDTTQDQSQIMPGEMQYHYMYNKTDVTPQNEMEKVKAGEPALFRYRNMTMLMNSTGNCDVIITQDEQVTPKTLALTVEHEQNMTLTMNMYKSPLQGQVVAERNLNFYLGIEPSAHEQIRGQIRLYINQEELNNELNREVDPSRLTWMFLNTTTAQWQTVSSYMDANGYIVCNTDHFSTWTVAEIAQEQTDNTIAGIDITYIIAAIIAAVIVVAVVGLMIVKKRK